MENGIEYTDIITEMNDAAFEHCKNALFSVFSHPVMKAEEYRKVDCIEDCIDFENEYFYRNRTKSIHAIHYVKCLKFYFDFYLLCEKGKSADRFYQHALDLMKKMIKENKVDFNSLCDVVKTYICLAKSDLPDFNDTTKAITSIKFELKPEDIYVLKKIYEYKFKMPQKLGVGQMAVDNPFPKYLSDDMRKFDYINTTILFYCILDSEGQFQTKENEKWA
jgi:hypothetical protein